MKKGELKKKTGFTIIEVSLVLAIAGLIFLMVFIALPQLQRQQRDSRRRDDILSFLETVKKYQTNNRGALPEGEFNTYGLGKGSSNFTGDAAMSSASDTSWMGFYRDYLGNNFVDPDGTAYGVLVMKCNGANVGDSCNPHTENRPYNRIWSFLYDNIEAPNADHRIFVFLEADCNGEEPVKASNPRRIAAVYKLEGAGVYCANT